MMAQRKATQTEAKRKAAERKANKETRRKEKEELVEHVRIRKEERAAKKVQREQAEAERRAHRGGRWVGVGIGAGGEGTITERESATAGEVAEAGAEGAYDLVATASAYRPPPWTSTSPPRDTNHVTAMVRPLSPPCMMQVHPSSQAMVSTAWAPQFHGPPNSPFLFNPVMAMQQMLPHPMGFTHNSNRAWLPQVGMTAGSDVRPAAEFTGGRFLAPDRASTTPQRHGMTTWHGSSWAL